MNQVFRCYAYRENERHYFARCLDLLLIGEGTTMEEAVNELNEIILGFLESVHANRLEDELIPRPYRFSVWLDFYARLLLNTLKTILGQGGGFLFFAERIEGNRLVYA
jgi:predicted RNase H-like HicB family nuclease